MHLNLPAKDAEENNDHLVASPVENVAAAFPEEAGTEPGVLEDPADTVAADIIGTSATSSTPPSETTETVTVVETLDEAVATPLETESYLYALGKATVAAVNWDFIVFAADLFHGSCGKPTLGKLAYGSFSITQELIFDDATWICRVPLLRSLDLPPSANELQMLSQQMSNGVASLKYVAEHTDIAVPKIHFWTTSEDGSGAGLPFRLESVPAGVPLSQVWEDLEGSNRWRFLEQLSHVYLELSYKCRLPAIGALYVDKKSSLSSQSAEDVVEPAQIIYPPPTRKHSTARRPSGGPHNYGLDYLKEQATACLDSIRATYFGSKENASRYISCWVIRSLLPHVYHFGHTMADGQGYALFPADFSTSNIMVDLGAEGGIKLTAICDWDFSSTLPNSSFVQFPQWVEDCPPCPGCVACDGGCMSAARLNTEQKTMIAYLMEHEMHHNKCLPLMCNMDFSQLPSAVKRALQEPKPGNDQKIWDMVHIGNPQKSEMYQELVEGLEKGELSEQMKAFEMDVKIREKIVERLGRDGDADMAGGNACELLEKIKDVPELEQEKAYLEDVLSR